MNPFVPARPSKTPPASSRRHLICGGSASFCALVACPTFAAAQQLWSFIDAAQSLTSQQNSIVTAIKNTPSTQEVRIIRLHPAVLKNSDRVSIPLKSDHLIWVKNSSREFNGDKLVS